MKLGAFYYSANLELAVYECGEAQAWWEPGIAFSRDRMRCPKTNKRLERVIPVILPLAIVSGEMAENFGTTPLRVECFVIAAPHIQGSNPISLYRCADE